MIKGLLCSFCWFVIWQRSTRQFWIWIKFIVSSPAVALLNKNYVFCNDPQYCCRIYNLRADGEITPSYQLDCYWHHLLIANWDTIYLLLIAVRCSKVWIVLLYIHSLSLRSSQKIIHILLLTNILTTTWTPQFIHRHLIHTHSTSAPFYPENGSFDICFGVGVL